MLDNKNKAELDRILFYFYARSFFSKPIIYNYNPHSLSKKIHVPENTVRRYIAFLKSKGYVMYRGKNLLFLNMRHFIETKKDKFIKVNRKKDFQKFKDEFYVKVIEYNFLQQEFAILGRSPIDSIKDSQDLKKHRKYVKNYLGGSHERAMGEVNPVILFASRTLARLLNISHSVSNNIINNLTKKKQILSEMFIEEISYNDFQYLKLFSDRYVFRKNNKFFLHRGRKLNLYPSAIRV